MSLIFLASIISTVDDPFHPFLKTVLFQEGLAYPMVPSPPTCSPRPLIFPSLIAPMLPLPPLPPYRHPTARIQNKVRLVV